MKSFAFLLFIILGVSNTLYAQQYTAYQDSLIKVLTIEKEEYQLLNAYFILTDNLYFAGKEKEGDYFYKELETFIKLHQIKSGAGCLAILKSYKAYYYNDDLVNAIIHVTEGIEKLQHVADTSSLVRGYLGTAMDELGYFYENAGIYDKALEAYLAAIDFSTLHQYKVGQMETYNNLFFLYSEYFGDDSLGIKYLEKALTIAEETKDIGFISTLNGNMAMLYIKMGELEKGDVFLEKAITIRTELKDTVSLSHAYLEKARLHFKALDLKKAQLSIDKCLDFAPDNCHWCYKAYITKGQIAKEAGNNSEAEKSFLLAQQNIVTSNLSGKHSILIHLAKLATDEKKATKAASYYAEAFEIKDSLDSQWKLGNAMKIEIRTKLAKVEAEKKTLKLEKNILAIKVDAHRKAVFLTILLLCLAIASGIYIFRQKSKLSEAYHILVQKNKELILNIKAKEIEKTEVVLEEKNNEPIISNELETALLKKIKTALESDKVFLNNALSLASFAKLLDTNTSYLSKIINRHYNKRFSTLVNEYRIKEILLYFESDRLKDITIFALAQEAGFNSKSAFNNAFKEYTGVTPTFYLKTSQKIGLNKTQS